MSKKGRKKKRQNQVSQPADNHKREVTVVKQDTQWKKDYQKALAKLDKAYGGDGSPEYKRDGWANVVAGLGGKMDKRQHTFFKDFVFMEDSELSKLYIGDGLGKKIIDMAADDMTREWVTLKGELKDTEKIQTVMDHLDTEFSYNLALKWMRLFGGSIIFIGALDGREPSEPLNMKNIKTVDFLKVIDRSDIFIGTSTFHEDPKEPNFGKVKQYRVELQTSPNRYESVLIHASRTVSFFGEPVPRRFDSTDHNLRYWGASALQAVWEKLSDISGVMGSVANILYELIIGVWHVDGLAEMLATGKENELLKRMETINLVKSIINAMLLDTDEEFTRDTANLGGIPDVIDRFMMMLSAVTGYPVTKLFGRSPAGENATGESDIRMYYDMIRSKQGLEMRKQLQYLIDVIAASEGIKDRVTFKFDPLIQMSPNEEAALEKTNADAKKLKAETIKILLESTLFTAEEIEAKLKEKDKLEEMF